MSMKPDMVKAMGLAQTIDAYGDVGEPPSLTGPALVNLCRAHLALSADHEALVKRVESVAKDARGLSDAMRACGERNLAQSFRDLAARLTEKAKP